MHRSHLRLLLLLLLAAALPLSGCLFRTRSLDRQFSDRPLKTATQQELIDYVNTQATRIQSMQATVDIDSSAGDPKSGHASDEGPDAGGAEHGLRYGEQRAGIQALDPSEE
jgi:hypothetical protein